MIGRKRETDLLRDLVGKLASGHGGTAWIEGEAGIGKSALLSAGLSDAARLGCQVFQATADEMDRHFPLRILQGCLQNGASTDDAQARIAGLLRGEAGPEFLTPQDAVVAATEHLLELVDRLCASAPVVLAVDDLHWADDVSLAVWGRLQGVVKQLPLLLVAAFRPVPARAELTALRHGLPEDDASVLRLAPLEPEAVTELVANLVGAAPGARLLHQAEQAGGNPLYLGELVAALVRERAIRIEGGIAELAADRGAPASLAAAIAGRLDFLSAETTEALRLAAVLGTEFSVAELARLAGVATTGPDSALAEAVAAGVLAGSEDRLAFRHTLIRQALYEGMPVALRSALHRQASEALVAAGAPAERVAEHLLAVRGPADSGVREWLADAAPSLIRRAPQTAIELLERVRATPSAGGPLGERIDLALISALFVLGRNAEIDGLARGVLTRTREAEVAAQTTWLLGYALVRLSRYADGLALITHVRGEHAVSAVWQARLSALEAMLLFSDERHAEAEAVATRATDEAAASGDGLARGYALHMLGLVRNSRLRDPAMFVATVDRALAAIENEPEATSLRLTLLSNRATALGNLGRHAEATIAIGTALTLAERTAPPSELVSVKAMATQHYFTVGRWDDALAELDGMPDITFSDPARTLWCGGLGALICAHRDDRAGFERHDASAVSVQLERGAHRYFGDYLTVARALAAERDGRTGEARALLLMAQDPRSGPARADRSEESFLSLPYLARLALDAGERDIVEAAAKACEDAAASGVPAAVASAAHCRALRDADPAPALSAADAFGECSYVLYRAEALEDAAVLLARRGDTAAARSAHGTALEIYTNLDAAWGTLRADTRLRSLGIRRGPRGPRGRPATGWEALTPTELTVADLVAAGRSNADVAAELFLSRRTVQAHISHILTKLAARSRVDIARHVLSRVPERVSGN